MNYNCNDDESKYDNIIADLILNQIKWNIY